MGSGLVRLGKPVRHPQGVAVASNREVQRVARSTEPSRGRQLQLGITEDKLEELLIIYDDLVGGKYQQQLASLRRYPTLSSREPADAFPIPWAVEYLRKAMESKRIDLDDRPTRTALSRLLLFEDVYNKWHLNPNFYQLAKSFANSFPHTASSMVMAAHLTEAGWPTALALETAVGDGNPDLYFRPNANEKYYIEVKAPKELQWMPSGSGEFDVDAALLRSLKSSRKQLSISKGRPGALVVSSAMGEEGIADFIQKRAWIVLGLNGRDFKSVSDILILSPARLTATQKNEGSMDLNGTFYIKRAANPHWQGKRMFAGDGPVEPWKHRNPLFGGT